MKFKLSMCKNYFHLILYLVLAVMNPLFASIITAYIYPGAM